MTDPSRLLAGRRGLSRPEKEAILGRVLDDVAPRPRWGRRLGLGALALAAAAAGAVALLPRAPGPPGVAIDELTARGGAVPAGFEVSCVPAPCAVGSKLVFDITSTGGNAYFAAFARSAERWIWYFPSTAEARSRPVPRGGGVLDTGIVLGTEHAPGVYAVGGVFSPAPLDRAAIRALVERGAPMVTREVTVSASPRTRPR
jgi:hypothetical protein